MSEVKEKPASLETRLREEMKRNASFASPEVRELLAELAAKVEKLESDLS